MFLYLLVNVLLDICYLFEYVYSKSLPFFIIVRLAILILYLVSLNCVLFLKIFTCFIRFVFWFLINSIYLLVISYSVLLFAIIIQNSSTSLRKSPLTISFIKFIFLRMGLSILYDTLICLSYFSYMNYVRFRLLVLLRNLNVQYILLNIKNTYLSRLILNIIL